MLNLKRICRTPQKQEPIAVFLYISAHRVGACRMFRLNCNTRTRAPGRPKTKGAGGIRRLLSVRVAVLNEIRQGFGMDTRGRKRVASAVTQ